MAEYMPLREQAPMLLGILWMFQVIAFILVALRLYTRLVVVHNYGIDDHFFNFAVFFLFIYVILMTVAARYGLGQEMTNPASIETSRALLLVNIGQTLTSASVISVKFSIACFLLRIVGENRAHKVAILLPVTLMSLIVFITAILLWFSCTPVSYSWDITVPGGHCDPIQQFWEALIPGVSIVLVELWYASFPWYLVRGLQMPRREQILISTSMSISYVSAACSILRLLNFIKLANADDSDFLRTIVDILIWHAADITTQLLCIGVTVCRPLYKDWLYRMADKITSTVSNSGGGDASKDSSQGARRPPDMVGLRTIGGSEVKPEAGVCVTDGPASPDSVPSWTLRRELVFQTDATDNDAADPSANAKTPDLEKNTFWSRLRKHP